MNPITAAIVWMIIQVLLFSLIGGAAFVLLRRRGPSAAVACAAMVLALTLPLVLLLASPWPRWIEKAEVRNPKVETNSKIEDQNTMDLGDRSSLPTKGEGVNAAKGSVLSTAAAWWQTATQWLQPGANFASADSAPPQAVWTQWIPWMLAAGIGLGLARLAAGVWAVGRLRSRSRPIDDPTLTALLRQLAVELNAPPVALCQTDQLRSAATIGWRRPVLLLPADWPQWTETERRVVLAHELAHVARRDYLTALLARLVSAIHFYQPLVLWLGRQLRIQQELAADAQAAALAGDRQTYLATLAQLALRADDQPLPWAARAFLPGTSMLIKRVAWLKRGQDRKVEKSLSRSGKCILAGVFVAMAVGVAGIRGPQETGSMVAVAAGSEDAKPQADGKSDEAKQAEKKKDNGPAWDVSNPQALRTFQFVPADAKLVVAVDPHELAKIAPATQPLVDMLNKEFEAKNGFKLTEVTDFELIWTHSTKQPDRIVARTEKAVGWKDVLRRHNPDFLETKHVGDHEYFIWKDSPDFGPCLYMVDDRTIVAGSEEQIQTVIRGGEKLMDANTFPEFMGNPLAYRAEIPFIKQMAGLDKLPKDFESNPVAAMFLPLLDHVQIVRAFAGPDGQKSGSAFFAALGECDSADGAQQVANTLGALRTLGQNLLQAKMQAWRQTEEKTASQEQATQIHQFFDILTKSLADVKIDAADKTVHVSANVEAGPALVAGFLMPAMASAKEAKLRTQSMNNLKMLALALLNYEDARKHFPPAVIRDKNGKPLLSWRVAVLPFIDPWDENKALYDQFHLDEPWDSEHNRELIKKMPKEFRDPHDPESSTNASYFMPTGKGMVGGSENGTQMKEIRDGTAMTILLVEAKRDIPWTKPEDIEIEADPTKPLPTFGGHLPDNVFGALFCDGHVQVISNEADPKALRAVFTIDGREPVDWGRLNSKPADKSWDASPGPPPDVKPVEPQKSSVPSDRSSGITPPKIEFHRADDQPATGLTEATAPEGPNVKIYLHPEAELTNADIAEATATTDGLGQPAISVSFTAQGAKKMSKLTEENLGKPMVIMVDGKVLSAPTIRSKIADGKAQISGHFTQEEAERIAKGINGG